jgi:hypothetical protein
MVNHTARTIQSLYRPHQPIMVLEALVLEEAMEEH